MYQLCPKCYSENIKSKNNLSKEELLRFSRKKKLEKILNLDE